MSLWYETASYSSIPTKLAGLFDIWNSCRVWWIEIRVPSFITRMEKFRESYAQMPPMLPRCGHSLANRSADDYNYAPKLTGFFYLIFRTVISDELRWYLRS